MFIDVGYGYPSETCTTREKKKKKKRPNLFVNVTRYPRIIIVFFRKDHSFLLLFTFYNFESFTIEVFQPL